MTVLPDRWRNASLDEIAQVTLGQSPPGDTYNSTGDGIAFFQGKSEFTEKYAEVRKYTTAGSKFAAQGDIFISVRAPVGPTNIAPVDCAIGRGLQNSRHGEVFQLVVGWPLMLYARVRSVPG
jgi:type I restriction enzyme S subunit